MKKGDISLIVGACIGLGCVLFGFILEKGNPLSLIGVSAFIIVFGGMSGALTIAFSLKDVLSFPKYAAEVMKAAEMPSREMADKITELAEKARKEGLLNLEEIVEELDDLFLRKGLKLVIDGVESETIEEMLENEIVLYEMKKKHMVSFFEAAGGFCPTMGIVGTVTGLILVMSNLGGDSSELGKSIATAFVATLYGIGMANIVLLPMASNLKNKLKYAVLSRKMILTGIIAIQHGESPTIVKQKLDGYIMEDVK
jgi:chemotaxis protein MotA